MKNILLSFVVFIITFSVFSQVCGGQFYDNGGINGDYLPNSNQTVTICPTFPVFVVTVIFTSFNTQAGQDGLYVYNGSTVVPSEQIASTNPAGNVPGGIAGSFWGVTNPGPFTSTAANGCLTFVFKSDNAVQSSGWIANVSCGPVTQGFSLNAFLDVNSNGTQNVGENSFPLGYYHYEKNNDGIIHYGGSPDSVPYSFFEDNPANSYDMGFTFYSNYTTLYSVPAYTGLNVGAGVVPVNFPVTSLVNYTDLAVYIHSVGGPQAGFNCIRRVQYANYGNQTILNGSLSFTNSPATTIVSISQPVTTTSTGFSYDFTNLLPFETRFIDVTMAVPSIPTIAIGQLLTHSASVSTPITEINLNNNTYSNTQAVSASYDPNDITESHGEQIVYSTFTPNDYLTYTIRFENTGTASAEDVRITDVLDAQIDVTSVRTVGSSHNCVLERVGTNLSWKFDNIQLPVSIANTTIGKGYVTFEAKLNPGFAIGTTVPNMANIYFDTNPAISTNIFNTEFVAALANNSFVFGNYFTLSPVPVSNVLTINTKQDIQITSVSIYNNLGQLVLATISPSHELDVATLKTGTYFIKIVSDKGTSSSTFIKE